MKIAYLNTLGIPARYRGFETCVEEVSTRLVRKGHNVTVYCGSSSGSGPHSYKGVDLAYVPRSPNKFIDYPTRSLLSTLDALSKDFDILHYYGTDSSIFTALPRALSKKKLVMSLDGLAWNRSSYPRWVQSALRASSWLPLYIPHATVVDSLHVREWYRRAYGRAPIYIPYGAEVSPRGADVDALRRFDVQLDKYALFVGALVREKGVHHLIRAFNELGADSNLQLIVVGGNPYGASYEESLRKMAGNNVRFLGYVYGHDLENLLKGAYLYVTASELEGTSPALLSAMGFGNCVVVSDIPENLETIGDSGVTFRNRDSQDLHAKILHLVSNPDAVRRYREKAVQRVAKLYSWDSVAERTERLYLSLIQPAGDSHKLIQMHGA